MPRASHGIVKPRGRTRVAARFVRTRSGVSRPKVSTFETFVSEETPPARKIELIRRGVGARVVDEMVQYLAVPKTVIFGVLRTPESTAHKLIKGNRPLDSAATERMVRTADITRMAEIVFGGREASTQWLRTPNVALHGATPLSMLDTEPGAAEVRRILASIDYGGAL